jgi:hypothetical protein
MKKKSLFAITVLAIIIMSCHSHKQTRSRLDMLERSKNGLKVHPYEYLDTFIHISYEASFTDEEKLRELQWPEIEIEIETRLSIKRSAEEGMRLIMLYSDTGKNHADINKYNYQEPIIIER